MAGGGGTGGGGAGIGNLSEEDQLLNELGYEETDNIVFRDRIFLMLNFFLVGGSFELVTTPPPEDPRTCLGPESLVKATFAALSFSVDLRPRLKYCSLDLSLGSLSLMDHSESNCLFPILVEPRNSKVSLPNPFLSFSLVNCPHFYGSGKSVVELVFRHGKDATLCICAMDN